MLAWRLHAQSELHGAADEEVRVVHILFMIEDDVASQWREFLCIGSQCAVPHRSINACICAALTSESL